MGFLSGIISWLTGGGVRMLVDRWAALEAERLKARNDEQRLFIEHQQARLDAHIRIAEAANADRWSATSVGRYLIVVPFGVWWTAIFLDSIFSFEWDVLALPPAIMDLAVWLVPAIVAADVGRSWIRRK